MTIRALLKTSGLAALATAMAVTALPSAASARPGDGDQKAHGDRGDRGSRGGSDARTTSDRGDRGNRGDRGDRGGRSADSSPRGGSDGGRGAWTPPARTAPAAAPAPARVVERGPGRGGQWQGGARPGTDVRGSGNHGSGLVEGLRHDARDRDRDRDRDRNRDRDHRNGNGDYRGGNHGGSWNNNGNHNGSWNNGSRNHGDYRQWDHRWRDNNRYNWRDWRSSHRNTFNLGRYYSPYRNYSYHRLGIGFFLDSLFYSNNYWINDPYQYRLPEAYGPYRWVRYYDDALLVDIYSGEVVDVMYDFFW